MKESYTSPIRGWGPGCDAQETRKIISSPEKIKTVSSYQESYSQIHLILKSKNLINSNSGFGGGREANTLEKK